MDSSEVVEASLPDLIAAGEAVVIHTGEVVVLADVEQVGRAYHEVKELEAAVSAMKRTLQDAAGRYRQLSGDRTIRRGGVEVVVEGGPEAEKKVDAVQLRELLLAAGMPQASVNEIVFQVTEDKVDMRKLESAAKSNPDYRAAAELCTTVVAKPWRIASVKITNQEG